MKLARNGDTETPSRSVEIAALSHLHSPELMIHSLLLQLLPLLILMLLLLLLQAVARDASASERLELSDG